MQSYTVAVLTWTYSLPIVSRNHFCSSTVFFQLSNLTFLQNAVIFFSESSTELYTLIIYSILYFHSFPFRVNAVVYTLCSRQNDNGVSLLKENVYCDQYLRNHVIVWNCMTVLFSRAMQRRSLTSEQLKRVESEKQFCGHSFTILML